MAQYFNETAHNHINEEEYDKNYALIKWCDCKLPDTCNMCEELDKEEIEEKN